MHPALYTRASMIREIAAAVGFISKFLRTKGLMNERQLQTFSQCLQELLAGEGGLGAAGAAPSPPPGPPGRAGGGAGGTALRGPLERGRGNDRSLRGTEAPPRGAAGAPRPWLAPCGDAPCRGGPAGVGGRSGL